MRAARPRPALSAPSALSALALALAVGLGLGGCTGESEEAQIAAARSYLEKKDTNSAVIQLKSALQKHPQSGQARLMLGQALLATGDPAGAAVELRKARELQVDDDLVVPDLARAELQAGDAAKVLGMFSQVQLRTDAAAARLAATLAQAHIAQGRRDAAAEQIAVALKAEPGLPDAVVLQAYLQQAAGETDAAMALLRGVLERQPGHLNAGIFLGDLLRQVKNDPEAALQAYRQVVEANQDAPRAHATVLSLLLAQGRLEDARTALGAMKKAVPGQIETLFYEAQVAFADKDYKTTRELCDRILKMNPNALRVLQLAGAAEYERQAWSAAEQMFSQALKLAPGDLTTRLLLAQTHLRNGQPERSLELLQPVLDGPDAHPKALEVAGDAYMLMGDAPKAEAALARASKLAPTDTRLRASLALSQLARDGSNTQAMQALEQLASKDSGMRTDLAVISNKLRARDIPGALAAIDRLQAKHPQRAMADLLRGQVQRSQRDLAGARRSFEAALAKEPGNLSAVGALAALDVAEGKPEAANQRLSAVASAEPNNARVRILQAELAARTGAAPGDVTRLLNEAVRANAGLAQPHLALVSHLLASGDPKAAQGAAQAGVSALPDNAELLDALARTQLAAGSPTQAVASYRKLVSMQPGRVQPLLGLAQAQAAGKDHDDAARTLRRAQELQPGLLATQRALVSLAIASGKPQDGLPVAQQLQKTAPGQALGHLLEGDVEAAAKRWDAAASAYRAATQRSAPEDAAIKLHQVLVAGGKRPEADRFAGEWSKSQPGDIAFRYYLGDLALAQGDLPAAEAQYRAVLQAVPQHALAMNNVAWLLVRQGKPGGLEMARQAAMLAPSTPAVLDTLATAQAASGQLPQAIDTQRKALALAPADPSLKLNLARHLLQAGQKPQARAELEELAALGDKLRDQSTVQELLKKAQ